MSAGWKRRIALAAIVLLGGLGVRADSEPAAYSRLSGPLVHGNLAVYFVHGPSQSGPVPLSLQEAMARKLVVVRETGDVNQLEIENRGGEAVFVQAGDILKGGQQDRVFVASLALPPRSGTLKVAVFCVESGRWAARSGEDSHTFSTSENALPSRKTKLRLAGVADDQRRPRVDDRMRPRREPNLELPNLDLRGNAQQDVWGEVQRMQADLSRNLGGSVVAPRSATSLQLSLENDRLEKELAPYVAALEAKGLAEGDILGVVIAINGRIGSGDVYGSNALFRKLWPKLLRANATEAIMARDAEQQPNPSRETVEAFLKRADGGAAQTQVGNQTRRTMRESDAVVFVETQPASAPASAWMHRNYLAK